MVSEPKISPLARGVIHPADPPRQQYGLNLAGGAIGLTYTPPERRPKDEARHPVRVNRRVYADRDYVTFDELDEFSQELQRFIGKIKTIEAAPHHAHEWGEPRPELVEEIVRAVVFAIASGTRDGAAGAVRAILEKEIWQAET